MVAAELPGTDEERAEAALIAAAGKILRAGHREVPEDFIAGIFAHAAPEDLLRYDPRQLAELAADAWSLLAVRKPGVPNIRLDTVAPPGERERRRNESVLEIVNDDMPFLVDSVLAELAERGIDVRFVVHPVLAVTRDAAGRLTALKEAKAAPGMPRESVIYIHLEPIDDEARRADIVAAIERVLADIRLCVADWRPMMKRVEDVIVELETHPPPVPADEIAEAVAFLAWLIDNNFTFLGVREYKFSAGEDALEPVFETGLGILRARDVGVVQRWNQPLVITPGDPGAPAGADAAHRHQIRRSLARPPARLYGLCGREAVRPRRQAHRRAAVSSACSPPPPIRARRGPSPICAARSMRCSRVPASTPTGIRARRW